MRLSRFSFPFQADNKFFIYNSRSNNFYEINKEAFLFIKNHDLSDSFKSDSENNLFINNLIEKKIITTQEEDEKYYESLKLAYLIRTFGNKVLNLTIAPTISCNLRCPYCFEQKKPKGIMNQDVIDDIIVFITKHIDSTQISITWFGGEPLLAINEIEKLLVRIKAMDSQKLIHHSMVTNATLLNKKAIQLFQRYPLDSIQITLDGFRDNHNKKRSTLDGRPTFDLICDNAEKFINACPTTKISFRINIDKTNASDYPQILNYLRNRFSNKYITVYPGILRANHGCDTSTFFSALDLISFYNKLTEENPSSSFYPHRCSKGCTATSPMGYVIGPKGELYLCWEHIGIPDKIIGYVNETKFINEDIVSIFLLHGHCFSDEQCRKCGFIPICSGGCPDKRIKNYCNGDSNDLCSFYAANNGQGIEMILTQFYKLKTNQS